MKRRNKRRATAGANFTSRILTYDVFFSGLNAFDDSTGYACVSGLNSVENQNAYWKRCW